MLLRTGCDYIGNPRSMKRCFSSQLLALLLFLSVIFTSVSLAAVPADSDHLTSATASRLFFWEQCKDRWNRDKNVMERCCSGNYKCSDNVCKGSRICSSLLLRNLLWCRASKCEPRPVEKSRKGGKATVKKKRPNKGKEKENHEERNKDMKKDDDKEKLQTEGEDKGNNEERDSNGVKEVPQSSNEADLLDDGTFDDSSNKSGSSPSPSVPLSPSATASPSPAPQFSDPLHCNGQRTRREIRDLTTEQLRQWREGIVALRTDRDENGDSEWDRLVELHISFNDEAHGGAYFLPWHRLFILRLENALRAKQPDLALPYWDWTQDASNAAKSRLWNSEYAGGALGKNLPIQNGAFQNMTARYPSWHIVRRNFTSGKSGDIPLLWSMISLKKLLDEQAWADFADGIEAAHSLPHIYIGGDMSNAHEAPNDPMFYLHHTFVDYLYSLRQKKRGAYQFGGTHDFWNGTKPANAEKVLKAFETPANRAFNLSCVIYLEPSKQSSNVEGRGEGPYVDDVCENEMFLTGESLTKDRCRRGEQVLENR